MESILCVDIPVQMISCTDTNGKITPLRFRFKDKTGELIAIKDVNNDNDIVIINKSGITIRLNVENLPVLGRATQGVKLINLEKRHDAISSVCKVDSDKVEDIVDATEEQTPDADNMSNYDGDLNQTED